VDEPLPTIDDVRRAAERLHGVAHRTPVLRSRTLDERTGAAVALKAENLQRIGAFKFRGAYNHLASLPPRERRRGVLTASSGNHAQAVALAARLHDTTAVVLMPEDAPPNKRAATEGYGAEVITFDRYTTDREELTARVSEERGLPVLHAYDDAAVIAGQGTVALELIEDAGGLDVLLVCLGGGGLISGCALTAKALYPRLVVIGVEPAERPAARRALEAGEPVVVPVARTIADGQQTASIGRRNHALIAEHVDMVIGVPDDEIVDAMRFLFERVKTVVEPSGASALAALLSGRVDAEGRRVGVTLSGGNVDAARFARLTT
jgi:threo-3-hydroxy-L-aspartate ammonia-lyase